MVGEEVWWGVREKEEWEIFWSWVIRDGGRFEGFEVEVFRYGSCSVEREGEDVGCKSFFFIWWCCLMLLRF